MSSICSAIVCLRLGFNTRCGGTHHALHALTVIARNERIFPANADTPSDLPEGDGLRQPSDDIAFVERAGLKASHQLVVKQRIYIREHRENGMFSELSMRQLLAAVHLR